MEPPPLEVAADELEAISEDHSIKERGEATPVQESGFVALSEGTSGNVKRGVVSLASQDGDASREPLPGHEWTVGVLPYFVETRKLFNTRFGMPKTPLEELTPLETYKAMHELCKLKPGAEPLKRSGSESTNDFQMRFAAQKVCLGYILPRAGCESEEQFKTRVQARKPRAPQAPKKPLAFVLPLSQRETPNEFEKRMQLQARTTFTVLPKGIGEDESSYEDRVRVIEESINKWAKVAKRVPPLVMPHGKHESRALFIERLKQAVDMDSCCILLPQAHGETDAQARSRLALQKKLKEVVVYPFDALRESPEEFEERLEELDPTRKSRLSRFSTYTKRRMRLGGGSARQNTVGLSLRKMSARFSRKVQNGIQSIKRAAGGRSSVRDSGQRDSGQRDSGHKARSPPKIKFASSKAAAGGAVWRPPSVKPTEEDDSTACCCFGKKPTRA